MYYHNQKHQFSVWMTTTVDEEYSTPHLLSTTAGEEEEDLFFSSGSVDVAATMIAIHRLFSRLYSRCRDDQQ